jgi:serine/threonine protein kinase
MWEKTSRALDLWSIGCIFAEMLMEPKKRRPLFPGSHYLDQLNKILKICGTPDIDTVKACEKGKKYLRSLPKIPKQSLKDMFPKASADAIDLLEKLLSFDPEDRITVEDALKHPFLKDLHDIEDEPTCKPFNFRFGEDLKKESIKKMIYDTIVEWNESENGLKGDAVLSEGVIKIGKI